MNMSKELKKDWLPKLQERYAHRHREGKSRMFDELCEDYGYGRLEDPALVGAISALYREVWAPWQNFFLPCLKLEQKWREGRHWRKRDEPPRTAYQRLCAPGMLTAQQSRPLRERYESLDPFALKDELEKKLKRILLPRSG